MDKRTSSPAAPPQAPPRTASSCRSPPRHPAQPPQTWSATPRETRAAGQARPLGRRLGRTSIQPTSPLRMPPEAPPSGTRGRCADPSVDATPWPRGNDAILQPLAVTDEPCAPQPLDSRLPRWKITDCIQYSVMRAACRKERLISSDSCRPREQWGGRITQGRWRCPSVCSRWLQRGARPRPLLGIPDADRRRRGRLGGTSSTSNSQPAGRASRRAREPAVEFEAGREASRRERRSAPLRTCRSGATVAS